MAEPVFGGFEGITTPDALQQQRRLEAQRAQELRRSTTSGAEFGAGTAGATAGRALSKVLRSAFPQTFDGQGVKARKAQEIIDRAEREAEDTDDDSAVGLINARIEAVKRARKRAREEGLHDMADQLAANEVQLSAQALEMRKLTAQTTAAETPEGFKELDRITEALARADKAENEGRLAEAKFLRGKAAKDAGISDEKKVPSIIATVKAMGLDPAAGEGFDLVKQSIEGAQKSDQRTQKINDLVARGVARDKAQDIVDGNTRMEVVPETGRVRLTNVVDGEAFEVPVRAQGNVAEIVGDEPALGPAPRAAPEEGRTLVDMAELATGPISAAKNALAVPQAWLGFDTPERVVQARQAMRTETQNLVRSLAINPRFPVAEQERIREEVNIQPRIWDDPSLLVSRMEQINDSLSDRMQRAVRDGQDPSLPEEHREAQLMNAANIANFLAVLGVEQRRENAEAAAGAPGAADAELPAGVPPGSRQIGTRNGNPVYEGPDGAFYEVD